MHDQANYAAKMFTTTNSCLASTGRAPVGTASALRCYADSPRRFSRSRSSRRRHPPAPSRQPQQHPDARGDSLQSKSHPPCRSKLPSRGKQLARWTETWAAASHHPHSEHRSCHLPCSIHDGGHSVLWEKQRPLSMCDSHSMTTGVHSARGWCAHWSGLRWRSSAAAMQDGKACSP